MVLLDSKAYRDKEVQHLVEGHMLHSNQWQSYHGNHFGNKMTDHLLGCSPRRNHLLEGGLPEGPTHSIRVASSWPAETPPSLSIHGGGLFLSPEAAPHPSRDSTVGWRLLRWVWWLDGNVAAAEHPQLCITCSTPHKDHLGQRKNGSTVGNLYSCQKVEQGRERTAALIESRCRCISLFLSSTQCP